ncbi:MULTISPECIES: glycine cleavage system protein R [Vibrio]|jgi:glycine cleavage system transcriptional repressor|uniref:Glycine cleavage system transcriptional repressor n=3 Tax=Vibrio TaxID=662 RepID=A0A0T7EAS3_9VIBR|nr:MULTISPECIES: glycine cleavage system protein R [Vibrio]KOY41687.1 glycine cleavage system protein R [Vibrio parahaemolyticus]MCR9495273.1 glycine cleavage system protein R [Vibrio alginolyticus]MEA3484356.1 glycine cleavage system protein R [Pseudomonadota bacterium]GAJ75567.1 glycine cleavage system transcriptional antiactivator GcvR [Vibrio sp. JCM 18905]ACY50954.1 glycine cleavage system transcriptional antiactivator GcvR [Vibrio antiquarius]
MKQHLVLTAVGTDRPGICNQVVHLVTQAGCNIVDSRIAIFGSEFTLIMLLTGNASSVTRVETQLPLLGQEHDLITIMKRTSAHELLDNSYTMEVFIESEDRPGLTEKFTKFFADQQIGLDSLSAQTISKSKIQLDADQFHIAITASVSADCNLMQLQEDFDELCQSLNVQGSLNFIKNTL